MSSKVSTHNTTHGDWVVMVLVVDGWWLREKGGWEKRDLESKMVNRREESGRGGGLYFTMAVKKTRKVKPFWWTSFFSLKFPNRFVYQKHRCNLFFGGRQLSTKNYYPNFFFPVAMSAGNPISNFFYGFQ